MEYKILYEDNQVIVVFKPQGILSQGDGTTSPDILSMLKKYIKEKYNKPGEVYLGLVHRLDRNTSGVMVFARTSKAANRLSDDIREHRLFEKNYIAVVEGKTDNSGELINNIYWDEKLKKSFVSNKKEAKEAKLSYELVDYKDNKSYVKIKLFTGRHHQIRCQFSHIGHPIYGDVKYGSTHKIGNSYALCAYKLKFIHPTLKEEMSFEYIDDDKLFDNFRK